MGNIALDHIHELEERMESVIEDKAPLIDASLVQTIFMDCLFKEEELEDGIPKVPHVEADGIVSMVGFHPERLEGHREEVKKMLGGLSDKFNITCGGGASFLEACYDSNGTQWTDLHQRMEQLFQLGIGLRLVKCLMPRSSWSALPGRMPYYAIL
jgi:hypothetical protein